MQLLTGIKESLFHLLFPSLCKGCNNDLPGGKSSLCIRCLHDLPITQFETHADNPVEKIFWGRLPVYSATGQFYFTKASLMQRLLHLFKYKGDRALGLELGQLMGLQLQGLTRFEVDALIPLPLFPSKERRRGFNQAAILCEGISSVLKIPVHTGLVKRSHHTESQTIKTRLERWKNMEGGFVLPDPQLLFNKRILLVDDVITTGATLEACGHELLKVEGLQLSIAALCVAHF